MQLELDDVLRPDAVLADLRSESAADAITDLCGLLRGDERIDDSANLLQEFLSRPREHETNLGQGVWLPHLRTQSAKNVVAAFGRWKTPVVMPWSMEPVRLCILVVAPPGKSPDYLRIVGQIARHVGYPNRLNQILAAPDAKSMRAALLAETR